MRIITIVLLAIMMLNLLCGCEDKSEELPSHIDAEEMDDFFEEVTLPQDENTEPSLPSTSTDSPDIELPSEGPDVEMTQQDALSGFSIKEKRFTYEYKDYILFDVTNETDTNYNLTVHAKYLDAEGKGLDETWEVYSDFAAGHQQYILLDPEIKFADCQYDFQVKETESDCWRSKVTLKPASMGVVTAGQSTSVLYLEIPLKNDTQRIIYIKLKGVLIFNSKGEIYLIHEHGIIKRYPSNDFSPFQVVLDEASSKNDLEVPEELKDGFTAIAVIESISED